MRLGDQEAVNDAMHRLVEREFPIQKVSIVGVDLEIIERVLGQMTYTKAALQGVMSGLWFGVFLGFFMTLMTGTVNELFFFVLVLSVGVGMLSSVVTFAVTRRRRPFRTQSRMEPGAYVLRVEPDVAGQARQILAGLGQDPVASPTVDASGDRAGLGTGGPHDSATPASPPRPRYGENPPQYGENPVAQDAPQDQTSTPDPS